MRLTDIVEGLEPILRRLIGEDLELFITSGPSAGGCAPTAASSSR